MESASLGPYLDDREEGEIVEDDFEDISDNSMSGPIFSGKSVSPKEHLPAISLSSVTELDEPKIVNKIRHRRKSVRKKTLKSHKKRRNSHRKSICSDSDSDDYLELDRKLQKQLKAAIQVDDTEERHKNSLRSRLKGMAKLDEVDGSAENNVNVEIKQKDSSDEGDSELAQLRLEALRTAVFNKFMHRKKRKVKENNDNCILSDVSVKTDNSETNKENNHNKTENCPKKICLENRVPTIENNIEITNHVVENNTPPEDDEDVLRALLLASMSKKITRVTDTRRTISLTDNGMKHVVHIVDEKKVKSNLIENSVASFKNRLSKNNVLNKNLQLPEVKSLNLQLQLPQVKPLIINVNGDSDSDDDLFNKTIKNADNQVVESKQIDVEIENTVEKFLKEQRAKVEAQLSSKPKPPIKPNNTSTILEKSSVKLLPKVKQVEYQKLLQKLKNAEKKPRIRRSSHKFNGDGRPIAYTSKKIVRAKLPVNKPVNTVSKVDVLVEAIPDVKNDLRTLHKILKEIQVQKNGRLQIQEKYSPLRPVMAKINQASIERKKREEEVKRLLQEIEETKKKLIKSQQEFSAHVSNLLQEKERIDKSMISKKCQEAPKVRFTSTPIKEKPPTVSFETSSLPSATPNSTLLPEKITKPTAENQEEDNNLETPLNPGDPNDIDKIYSIQKTTFPKYISPLDNVKRVVKDDPFSIICPYDVDGNCRDPECIYKHLFK